MREREVVYNIILRFIALKGTTIHVTYRCWVQVDSGSILVLSFDYEICCMWCTMCSLIIMWHVPITIFVASHTGCTKGHLSGFYIWGRR